MNLMLTGLNKITKDFQARSAAAQHRVLVCAGTGCLVNGSLKVYEAFVKALKESGLNAIVELKKEEEGVFVSRTGCQGFCQIGPLVTVLPENIFYTKVKPGDVAEIVETTIRKGDVVERLLYVEPDSQRVCRTKDEIPFYRKQHRFALSNCGAIDPESVEEYIASGGYRQAIRAYLEMSPEDICQLIFAAGLRGRGGGGQDGGELNARLAALQRAPSSPVRQIRRHCVFLRHRCQQEPTPPQTRRPLSRPRRYPSRCSTRRQRRRCSRFGRAGSTRRCGLAGCRT